MFPIRLIRCTAPAIWLVCLVLAPGAPAATAYAAATTARAAAAAHAPATTASAPFVPGQVLVGYRTAAVARAADTNGIVAALSPETRLLTTLPGESVSAAISRLNSQFGVAYAVPNYIAHVAGSFIPNDPGSIHRRGGWERLQWNFLAGAGIDAPAAWANLIAAGHPGGRGATVAVLDTGVAYRNWHEFLKMPDFTGTRFTDPYDFVARNRYPLDREGHGTFIAAMIAESTNNGIGLTGIAYGATVMPIRVLDASGNGDALTISRGIRYAADHGAQVINLSLEFPPPVGAKEIPEIIGAIKYAHQRGALVVAAAGNEGTARIAYPARSQYVLSVAATTRDRCLADYSDMGVGLGLVAPGGGNDSSQFPSAANCRPGLQLPNIFQMTLMDGTNPRRFGLPGGYYGTSMAAGHASGVAALVIASGVIGRRPSPDQVMARLEGTAQPLGSGWPNTQYGHGLLNAAAATNPAVHVRRVR